MPFFGKLSRILSFLILMTGALSPFAYCQSLNLDQAVQLALSKGLNSQIVQETLAQNMSVYNQTLAQNSLAVSTTANYSASKTGDSAVPHELQGSLGVTLPSTSLTVGGSETMTPISGTSIARSDSLSLSLSQTLWDGYLGGSASGTLKKNEVSRQLYELTASNDGLTVIYNVKQAFYTMLSDQDAIPVLNSTIEQYKTSLNQMQAEYDLKQATLVDLQAAQVNLRSAELDLKAGQNSLKQARMALADLLGLPRTQLFSLVEVNDPEVPVNELDAAIVMGLENRMELKQYRLNQQSALISKELAFAGYHPTISVTAGYELSADHYDDTSSSTLTVGLRIKYSLFDSGLTKNQTAEYEHTYKLYTLQETQERLTIKEDIETAWDDWNIKKEKLSLAQFKAEELSSKYEIVKAQNEAGTQTISDLQTAEVNAMTAKTDLITARINLQLAALKLENVLGL